MPPRKSAATHTLVVPTLEPDEFEVRTNKGNRTYIGTYSIEGGTLFVKPVEGENVTLSPSGWTEIVER